VADQSLGTSLRRPKCGSFFTTAPRRDRPRGGFTLIELLVVIAIISVLVGLLMPAVQKVREAANRIACANNLKQLGLAALNYESDRHTLPPGRIVRVNPDNDDQDPQLRGGATWAVYLLPYLEQDSAFKRWDFNLWYHYQDQAVRMFNVPTYFCPSRRSPSSPPAVSLSGDLVAFPGVQKNISGQIINQDDDGDGHWVNISGGLGDYAANFGTDLTSATGPFRLNNLLDQGVRLLQIIDGTSNTILLGEKHVPMGSFGLGNWDCSIYDGDNPLCSGRAGGPGLPIAQSIGDPGWKWGGYHTGVCQFVFADGSVHALANGLSPTTLELLCDIADAQVIPPYE
jgi:prepilin-type N-terminal cleavage/methylation domain-containing protein